jgi:DNA-binding transcriptional ArsR family regulator
MDLQPTLWRTCRVLANERRIGVLAYICANGSACVTETAAATHISQPQATQHLRLLQSRGLLRATRSSRWVTYAPIADPLVKHARGMLEAIQCSLKRKEPPEDIICALTAFTHPRRLLIVLALLAQPLTFEQLVARCRISPPALYRHLRKLERRGVLAPAMNGTYQLCTPPSKLLHNLIDLVAEDP